MQNLINEKTVQLKRYEKFVRPYLENIVKAKMQYVSNSRLIDRINKVAQEELGMKSNETISVQEFQNMIEDIEELNKATKVGIAIMVDELESKLFKKALKDGNVTALLKCLAVLNPEKWDSKQQEEAKDIVLPEFKIEVVNAQVSQEELDAYVEDLMEKTGQIGKS